VELLWPSLLYLLVLVPLIIAAYVWGQRRRRRFVLRYSSVALVRPALARHSWLRRHLPFALFLLGLVGLLVALARPVAVVALPSLQSVVILSIDVSGSMRATDVQPSRIEAAQAAANEFVDRQNGNLRIGIVAFSGSAELVQAPTTDREALHAAIDRLYPERATALGSGILESLDAIAEAENEDATGGRTPAPNFTPTPAPKGVYAPAIIVLLTDGVSNAGPAPLDAAQEAVDRGVRIYTIGFGTQNGTLPGGFGGGGFGGGGFGGFGGFGGGGFGSRFRVGIDETTLKNIAAETGGSYYRAASAQQLQSVFQSLPTYLILKRETIEITVGFTAVGALFCLIAITLSLLWHPLP
jgi:Ca-activated chloride channel homolog